MSMKQVERNLYICDPDKNTTCKKTACYVNGGPCNRTFNPDCARTGTVPIKTKEFVEEENNGV